jgi:polygalacturonase
MKKSLIVYCLCIVALLVAAGCDRLLPKGSDNASPEVFDVRKFGAKGDGKMPDTEAIQKALDECGNAGGGIVRLTAGTYLSKPISLRSNTTLQLDEGAMLKATDDPLDFLPPDADWQTSWNGKFIPFIGGEGLINVTISGKGIIDGSGLRWWIPAEADRKKTPGYTLPRPNLIVLTDCNNVRLENITLQNSPKFHFVPTNCDGVVVSKVTVLSPRRAPNSDAIDPSVCRNVLITDCYIDVGDDNIAIKSGKAVPGREFASEDITVQNCTFLHGHGMSIGSETNSGVRNVTVQNCTFEGTENGLRIKSTRGKGGIVENISYSDITMKNVNPAITLSCKYGGTSAGDSVQLSAPDSDTEQPLAENTPIYRDIRITNLKATCQESAGIIEGLPESLISGIVFDNVNITAVTGMKIENAENIKFKNTIIETQEGPALILENAVIEESE